MSVDVKLARLEPAHKPPGRRTSLENSMYKFKDSRWLLLLLLPCILYYAFFVYAPMWGIIVSFKDYKPFLGFSGSKWVGFKHYMRFFTNPASWQLLRNTLTLSVYELVFGFTGTIVFALIVNEILQLRIKKAFQTITYIPYFISTVIIVGMLRLFLNPTGGLIFDILQRFGFPAIDMFAYSKYFRMLYVTSGIWQNIGWGAVIFYAAFAGISPELYESAVIDGANKLKRIVHITLPGILPIIIIRLILYIGSMLTIGFDKIFLMQTPTTISVSEVIETYIFKYGIGGGEYGASQFSYGAAMGMFNSVVNMILLFSANFIAKKTTKNSLF